jgi:hypothetical protein
MIEAPAGEMKGEKPRGLSDLLPRHLGERWQSRRDNLSKFFGEIGLKQGEFSQALYILPVKPTELGKYLKELAIKVANEGEWSVLLSRDDPPTVLAFPVSPKCRLRRSANQFQKSVLALYTAVHSRLITWWLINAWRSEQLASATWSLGDSFKIIPAAACARSLLETAASFWLETVKLRETWHGIKLDCWRNGPDHRHYYELTKLIYTMLWSAKFDKKVPELAQTYGKIERTNVLTLIDKLAQATSGAVHEDYQWLCNAVHPSIGGMLAFAAPMMGHDTKTHAFQWVCSEPLHFEHIRSGDRGRGGENRALWTDDAATEERQTTIEEAVARSAAFAVDVLERTLDDALRIIDDIGLTTHAPGMASFRYWRQISQKGQNSMCPCRSGRKVKHCLHRWLDEPPEVTRDFSVEEQSP